MIGHDTGSNLAKKSSFKKLGKLLKEGLSSQDISGYNNFKFKNPSSSNKKYSADEAFDFLALIHAWPEVIGQRLAQNTIPLKNTRRTLTILTNHPAYSEQLKFMEVQLLQKIKKRFPSLQNSLRTLYFKTDSTFFHKQKVLAEERSSGDKVHQEKMDKAFHKFSPEYRRLKKEADLEFENIESDEMREKLISIYIQSRQAD